MQEERPSAAPEPTPFVGYTRTSHSAGQAERFLAMAEAYKGFQQVLGMNVLLTITFLIALGVSDAWGAGEVFAFCLITTVVANLLATRRAARQFAVGCGRSPEFGLVVSILFALQSWFIFGAVGYAVLEQKILREMKQHGVNPKFGGLPKGELERIAAHLRSKESVAPPVPQDLSKV